MPVKREPAMDANDSDCARDLLSKRSRRNVLIHSLRASVSKGRVEMDDNEAAVVKGSSVRKRHRQTPSDKLVKIELDAAQALAEFSRIAHLPMTLDKPAGESDSGLQWFSKRKRSTRTNKDVGSREMERDASLITPENVCIPQTNFYSSQVFQDDKGSSSIAEREDVEYRTLPESSKESLASESRAESPSSPLPSLPLQCRTVLIGGAAAGSAFQKVVPVKPVRKSCPLQVKAKVEDMHLDFSCVSAGPAQKMTVKRRPRIRRPSISLASVKVEQLLGDANSFSSPDQHKAFMKDSKDTLCQGVTVAELGMEALLDRASQVVDNSIPGGFRVVNKAKPAVTEMEKEARRLHRVQANRESARQTIRRKQILCEELTARATSLALENEGMRQKKELLMQELYSLKDQNCHLKQQLAMQSSSNLGHDSFQLSARMPLQPVSLPSLQMPAPPYSRMPVQSFVWALAVAQATSEALSLQNSEMLSGIEHNLRSNTNDSSSLGFGSGGNVQHQSSPFLFPHSGGMPQSNHAPNPAVAEQEIINTNTDSRMPDSVSQKEASSVSGGCVETSTRESTGMPCECRDFECNPMNLDVKNIKLVSQTVDGAGHPACQPQPVPYIHARCSSVQPAATLPASSFKSQSNMSEIVDGSGTPGRSLGSASQQFTRALSSYGIPSNGSRTGVSFKGSLQGCSFTGRKTSAAAMAAAEARRRRKELTRSKFLQSRAFRLRC